MYTSDLFKKWIIDHQNDDCQINVESEQTIKLTTSYGEATIQFTDVTNGTIVEFNIISYKNQEVQFYLHFELNDENHAHQLYDEMIETLIGLKDKKTTRVLLSCSSGLTTSMFADNLNSVVEMLGEDYHFDAVAYSNIYEQVENCDLVLIAPQIGYMLKRLQESLPDKLVLQIPTATFASYDAIGAIKFIQSEIENYNKEKKEFFKFKNKIGYQRIDVQDIYYFESENKIVKIHCINNIIKFYGKLNDVEQKLNDSFIRIHSSILVNTVYIAQFKYNEVKMINGELLPISQSRRQDIRKKQMDRWENNS